MAAMSFEERVARAVLDGDAECASSLAKQGLDLGRSPIDLVDLNIQAIREVGRLWEEGEYFLPELVSGAQAVQAALKVLRARMATVGDNPYAGRRVAVVGTVQGDIHDIGKSLVANMLTARGFDVVDLGIDVAPEAFADALEQNSASLLGLSALLTTTMLNQKTVIDRLKERGLRDRVKVLVGGAPVTTAWVEEIDADGTADNAVSAADLACRLVNR